MISAHENQLDACRAALRSAEQERDAAIQAHEVDKHHLVALRQSAESYAARMLEVVAKQNAAESALGALQGRPAGPTAPGADQS